MTITQKTSNILYILFTMVFIVLFLWVIGQYRIENDPTFHQHTAECAQGNCPYDVR